MTLLANRDKTKTSDQEESNVSGRQNGHVATDRKITYSSRPAAPVIAPPEGVLRTLQVRLQAQLSNSNGNEQRESVPEAHALVQSVRGRLNQVNAALERIEEGKYGVCTDCEKPIENDRLILQPMSTRCTRCQAIAEWRGVAY